MILVVDDQESHCELVRRALHDKGFPVDVAGSGPAALQRMEKGDIRLLLTDQLMPGMSGIELMQQVHAARPLLPVVIVTAYGSVDTAVNAMKSGAADYIQKPFLPDELLLVVRRVLEREDLVAEVKALRERVGEPYQFHRIISKSPRMVEIFEMVRNLADLDTTVLITGETGTGKELVAHAIHYNSNRRAQRFVRINCGALSETLLESELFGHERGAFSGALQSRRGKFEYASGGTLLLDEIGDISAAMQIKLLRVLQEKEIQRVGGNETIPVNVRILATTNKPLEQAVADGSFRSDLYYRLNVVRIQLPPLRERMEDVPLLIQHFVSAFCEKTGREIERISNGAMNAMLNYAWPGNVRELANVIERAAALASEKSISSVDLASYAASPLPVPTHHGQHTTLDFKQARQQVIAEFEKTYLSDCLRNYRGNIAQCAKHCGVDNKTFYRKMQEYGLDKRNFKAADDPMTQADR